MPIPTEEEWNVIADEFWTRWQFPNCIGALDGKHVTIEAPKMSGSLYYNYKKTYSIVLLALVDPLYNFILVDVGAYGKNSDGGILINSNIGKSLENDTLNIPRVRTLPGTDTELPMVIVADEAFPLKTYLMRPYPGRDLSDDKKIYNYRLSRARRLSENVFGILLQKCRIFSRRLQGKHENLTVVLMATCVLYNFIRQNEGSMLPEVVQQKNNEKPGRSSNLKNITRIRGRSTNAAFAVREQLKTFFSSVEGSVDWQEESALAI